MSKFHNIAALFLYNSCLAIFLTYGLFFNRVAVDFGQSPTSTTFVFAAFAILYDLSSLFMGLLLDRIGPSRTMMVGGSLMGVGLILSSLANSLPILVLTYGLIAGAGTGSMWPTTSYLVFDKFGAGDVRTVTGVVSAGTAFGSLFFAPLEAFLISTIQWRPTFVVLGAIVLAFVAAAAVAAAGSKINVTHSISSALPDVRTKRFGSLYGYYALGNAFSRTIVLVFIVPMLEFNGASLFLGSIALSLIGAGSILGRFAAGLKWLTEEQILGLSFVIQGISTVFLLYARDLITVAVWSLIFGIGYGGYIPEFALIVRKYFGLRDYGAIFGLLLTSYAIGAFAGPIFEAFSLEVSGTFTIGFYLAAVVSVLVGLHQLASERISKKPEEI
jgi:OFA family oxalate/formate antiporter-like MFS transporter